MNIREDHQVMKTHRPLLDMLTSKILVIFTLSILCACTGKIESTPEEMTDNGSSVEEVESEESTSEESTSEESTSEESTSEESTSEGTTPEEATPEETTPEETTPEETTPEETTPEDPVSSVSLDELDRNPIEETEGEEVTLTTPVPIAVLERPRRRMTLDQLDQAIQQVSGGLIWSERRNNQDQNLFESMSSTLGKPDFVQRTSEDLSPSALFMKFLDDAARQVCGKRIDIDLSVADNPREAVDASVSLWGSLSPTLTTAEDQAAIEQQIKTLVLRYHSHDIPEGDSPRLAYWRWLFETASLVDQNPVSGWRALCIALITHPDFYSY